MSLINEALKKAQKQRTGEAEPLPAVGGESAARIARRGKPAGFNGLLVGIGAGVVALIAIIVVAVIFLRRPAAGPATVKPAPVVAAPAVPTPVVTTPAVQAPAPKPVEVAVQPVVSAPASVRPAATVTIPAVTVAPPKSEPVAPVVTAPAPTPIVQAPVASAPGVSTPVVITPVVTAPAVATAPPAPRAPGKMEHRAVTFIESIRVAGIRASGSDRKVLMNDRVYRLNDLVEPEMGLTLIGIATNSLTFQDENGAKYTRNF